MNRSLDEDQREPMPASRWLRQFVTRLRQRRERRGDELQRLDPAGAGDDEQRADAAGDRRCEWKFDRKAWKQKKTSRYGNAPQPEPAGFLSPRSRPTSQLVQRVTVIERLYLAAVARKPERGGA